MRPIIASLVGVLVLLAAVVPMASAQTPTDCTQAGVLRIINASSDVGAVDVLVNGQPVATNLAFQAASGFSAVSTGTVKIEVRQTGKTTAVSGPTDITVAPGSTSTVTITGLLAAGGGQQPTKATLATTVIPEDLTAPAAGQARIDFTSLADVGGNVDVLVNDQPVITNVAFNTAATPIDVPPGRVTIRVVKTGTTENAIPPLADVDLVAGRTYTIFSSGVGGTTPTLSTQVLVDRSFDAQARFVHASPNAPPIDVITGGKPVVSNLAYPNATPYVPFASGGACVVVAPTGQTTPALAPVNLNLESGGKSTSVVLGLQGGTPALSLATFSDTTAPPATGKAKIRVINASPDAGPIDVFSGTTAIITNLAFAAASDFIEVDAGALKIHVNKTGGTETILPEIELTVSAGQIVTLVVRGTLNDKTLGLTILTDVSPA